jgi:DNA-binding IclR family transcriptional regulator
MSESTSAHTTVRAVDRALDILLCFSRSERGLSLSDIAREVDLHKSTVHRLLASLQQKGFVRKHSQSDKYLLGWSVLELIANVYQSDELSTVVLPEMTRLRDLSNETVSLYIRSGVERIRIQAVESNAPVRNVASIGKTYPLHVGASGKVLLAYASDEVIAQALSDGVISTGFNKEDFLRQLGLIREQGYSISVQERDVGAGSIAAPIYGRNHEFVAAIAVSGPFTRFTVVKMQAFSSTIKESAARITKLLSH